MTDTGRPWRQIALVIALSAAACLATACSPKASDAVRAGRNSCDLSGYQLENDGFADIETLVERSEGMPEASCVSSFTATLKQDGSLLSFSLELDTFDADGGYRGAARYRYEDKVLCYEAPEPGDRAPAPQLDKNRSLSYLSDLIKRIPIADQIRLGGLTSFILSYRSDTMLERGTPVFEARSSGRIEARGPNDYNNGLAGRDDGSPAVLLLLSEGGDTDGAQRYWFRFALADEPPAPAQGDYKISGDALALTRDCGRHWIDSGLTTKDVKGTLAYHRQGLILPPHSVFAPADTSLPLAYFYGGHPTLRISADEGATWSTTKFPGSDVLSGSATRRFIGFSTSRLGYAALGTDWSMGAGESKLCFLTDDGGKTWEQKALPLTNTSSALAGFCMADMEHGMLALDADANGMFPKLFATSDRANTWTEIKLPFGELPGSVGHLVDIDSFTRSGDTLRLVLGQGSQGTKRTVFETREGGGDSWRLVKVTERAAHGVG